MKVFPLFGVVQDGTVPQARVPTKQPVYVDRATDNRFPLTTYGASGSVIPTTADSVIMTVRKTELAATIAVSASLSAGSFTFTATQLALSGGAYLYDVRRTEAVTGFQDVVVPESLFFVNQNIG